MNGITQLETIGDVIDAFGGVKAMCATFGGVPSRFANYKLRGSFPPSMHMRIYDECMKRGLNIAPELVGMSAEVAQRLIVKPPKRQLSLPAIAAE